MLLVDDDAEGAEAVRAGLEGAGFTVAASIRLGVRPVLDVAIR